MNGVNLIPSPRRAARVRRRQVRMWSAAVILSAGGLLGGYACLWSAWQGRTDLLSEAAKVTRDIESAKRLDKLEVARVAQARAAAAMAREVLDQPDWGLLLAFVAEKLGQGAALDAVSVKPPASKAGAATPPGSSSPQAGQSRHPGASTLVLSGVARSQEAASTVAINLKESGLFNSVNLVEARRTGFMGEQAVAFRIECVIVGAGGTD